MPLPSTLVPSPLPLLTTELPGCGGHRQEPEDFVVREIPAYLPCGEGEHVMVHLRKRELTTPQAVRALCDALGVDAREAGVAGLKDRHAVTEQWVSLHGTTPEAALAVQVEGVQVLQAGYHRNKLKTGHLRGNRFEVTLRGVDPEGEARATALLSLLGRTGLPNYFGVQRFGREGDNADRGLAMLRGEERGPRDGRQRRLLFSSLQSALFNAVLARRVAAGAMTSLLGGEVLQKTGSHGLFVSDDAAVDGPRLAAGEVVVTGPLYGPRMPWPAEGGPAHALELAVLQEAGLSVEDFRNAGRLARGGRRPLTMPVDSPEVQPLTLEGIPALRLSFGLPPGTYATVLLDALTLGTKGS